MKCTTMAPTDPQEQPVSETRMSIKGDAMAKKQEKQTHKIQLREMQPKQLIVVQKKRLHKRQVQVVVGVEEKRS
jgi:hypothetical protein